MNRNSEVTVMPARVQRSQRSQFAFDALIYTFSAFGGPQAHLAYMLRQFVEKRKYLTETELLELNALAQVLPGPSSSQTLAGLAFKIGGLYYAIGIYLIWMLPSAILMCLAAIFYKSMAFKLLGTNLLIYVESMAVGFVAYAAWTLLKKSVKGWLFFFLAGISLGVTMIANSPYIFPLMMFLGGFSASVLQAGKEEKRISTSLLAGVNKLKLFYFFGIFGIFALLGAIIHRTSAFSLPVRLFQNFYRNGVFVYGGGQVMVPFMYTEFVSLKKYLSSTEFLSGYALQQAIPGPTFSFTSFVGAMSMGNAGYSAWGQVTGSILAVVGINAPGLILMLFIVPFWEELKKITHIKNSLTGINAVSVGFILAALILLVNQVQVNFVSITVMILTFLLLCFTRIPSPVLILTGLVCGYFFH